MKLHEAIAYAIDKEGTEIVCRSLLVNYLADLQAYDTPAVKRIVETIVSGGYGEKLLGSLQAADYDLQVADTVSRMVKYEGYQQDLVEYVLSCLSYALGKNVEQPMSPITQAQSTPQPNKRRTVTSGIQKLSFIQTSNGYQTEIDGETYTIDERDYRNILRKKAMPMDRLKIWLNAYSENALTSSYKILKKHSLFDTRHAYALFKEAGVVVTFPKEHHIEYYNRLHKLCEGVITLNDLERNKAAHEREMNDSSAKSLFYTKPMPSRDEARNEVKSKLTTEFDFSAFIKSVSEYEMILFAMSFNEEEPTRESIEVELTEKAEREITSFLPWKQSKLRTEYVEANLEAAFDEAHKTWQQHKSEYEGKKQALQLSVDNKKSELEKRRKAYDELLQDKTQKLYDERLSEWRKGRDDFYKLEIKILQDAIDGDKASVEGSIGAAFDLYEFANDSFKFFVDFVYEEEEGKVYVDLELPRIEDVSGKYREVYANCVFGLSMYVANTIFNQSVRINEVEIAGYTQRTAYNSALATDQYLFVVRYERELFDRISVSSYTPVQMVEFFPHCKFMTETYLLREINLATAFNRMDAYEPIDFDEYVALHPMPEETSGFGMQDNITTDNNGASHFDIQGFDPYLEEAAYAIIDAGMGSTSVIQRKLSIGYNHAGRIMDQLEKLGIIGPAKGSKPREVLVTDRQMVKILTTM